MPVYTKNGRKAKVRVPISRTGGQMTDRKTYTRKKKHRTKNNEEYNCLSNERKII